MAGDMQPSAIERVVMAADVYRDGAAAERAKILALLRSGKRQWLHSVLESQSKTRSFNAPILYYEDIERVACALADEIEKLP